MAKYKLGEDFLLGTATSSTQIEGGDTNNTWRQWCEAGHILDKSSCITACDHWNRVDQDTALLKRLNVHTHRMSLEWSRLEPLPGQYSKEALDHYRYEIELLTSNGIQPLVTLHHFSEPLWFHELGGWLKSESADYFTNYVSYVVGHLGDLVREWVTFNEPNVYSYFGYAFGNFPPGSKNLGEALSVLAQIIKTHIKTYEIIHRVRKEKGFRGQTMVGAANHVRVFDGVTKAGKLTARAVDYLFNELALEGLTKGRLMFPLSSRGWKYRKGRYADYLGINYYTRNIVEFAWESSKYFHTMSCDPNCEKTDLGWDIYPEGIYQVCKKYYPRYKLPIYITENGISDGADTRRAGFITDHLAYLIQAVKEGIKIERYYYWSLMDNFEWLDGEEGYFGLYHCNFRTQERKARKSAEFFARICAEREFDLQK